MDAHRNWAGLGWSSPTSPSIAITTVVIAAVMFEIWFFVFSGSPFDQRSGRRTADGMVLDRCR